VVGMREGWGLIRDFIDKLSQHGRRNAIYRGQACEQWKVIPSAFREGVTGITDEKRLNDWKWRSARFAAPLPQDSIEWLLMAQHYGLPTPLLDWTTSPLVALFFACQGEAHAKCNGEIWVSNLGEFEVAHHTLYIDPFRTDRARPFAINGVGRNVRSTAQDSVLTLHTRSDCENFNLSTLFTVPAAFKQPVVSQLSKLGVTADRLLYDIHHLVKDIKLEYNRDQ